MIPLNKPKEHPNSKDMMGRLLRTGGVWVRCESTRNLLTAQDRSAPEDQRHHGWNLAGTVTELVEPSAEPCGGPRRICPRTIESPKAILPPNLAYGWRPQSYCCWGKNYTRIDTRYEVWFQLPRTSTAHQYSTWYLSTRLCQWC